MNFKNFDINYIERLNENNSSLFNIFSPLDIFIKNKRWERVVFNGLQNFILYRNIKDFNFIRKIVKGSNAHRAVKLQPGAISFLIRKPHDDKVFIFSSPFPRRIFISYDDSCNTKIKRRFALFTAASFLSEYHSLYLDEYFIYFINLFINLYKIFILFLYLLFLFFMI